MWCFGWRIPLHKRTRMSQKYPTLHYHRHQHTTITNNAPPRPFVDITKALSLRHVSSSQPCALRNLPQLRPRWGYTNARHRETVQGGSVSQPSCRHESVAHRGVGMEAEVGFGMRPRTQETGQDYQFSYRWASSLRLPS